MRLQQKATLFSSYIGYLLVARELVKHQIPYALFRAERIVVMIAFQESSMSWLLPDDVFFFVCES